MVDENNSSPWWLKALNFTKEEKITFVNHVRERPALWNYKLSYQHKHQKRQDVIDQKLKAWEEITDIYGGKDLNNEQWQDLNVLIQRKWRLMRDNYVKVYKSDNQKYKSDPLFLAINSFLDEITEENMRIRSTYKFGTRKEKSWVKNNGKSCEEGEENNENMKISSTLGTPNNLKSESNFEENNESLGHDDGIDLGISSNTCGELDIPIELELNVDDENNPFGTMLDDASCNQNFQSSSVDDLRQHQPPDELDECDIFGQFIAVKLRKMDPQARSRLQFLIHQTIFNDENSRNDSRASSNQK